ncbi:MAG: response regulator [Deltaproteobacteria bacterium]|nr:response regulator [Deltaproteobacteria bacterium]
MSLQVLIVDDSSSMRRFIKRVIAMSGFRMDPCLEAPNGKRAIEILEANPVDLIVSDTNMPEMNGLELIETLHRDVGLQNIPVIVVTTEGTDPTKRDVFASGARGFVKKPFTPEELKKVLGEVLGTNHRGGECGDDGTDDGCLDF